MTKEQQKVRVMVEKGDEVPLETFLEELDGVSVQLYEPFTKADDSTYVVAEAQLYNSLDTGELSTLINEFVEEQGAMKPITTIDILAD